MANNTLLTNSIIAREALAILENNLGFSKLVNRNYDDNFAKNGAKIGNSLDVRLPVVYTTTSGPNLSVQDTKERTVTIKLDQQEHVDMEFTSVELALDIDDFKERYLRSAIAALANKIDSDGLKLVKGIANTVGDPTKLADTLKTYLLAGVKLDNEAVPKGADMRGVVVGPAPQAAIVDGLSTLFNDVTEVSKQYKTGNMGLAGGFKWSMDQNVQMHTNGTGTEDTVQVDGANQTGSTLKVKGLVGTLNEGDTFTIAGVYAINPMSKQSTGKLKDFVVTANAAAGATNISISPSIITAGNDRNVNVESVANNANLVFVGGAGAMYELDVAFHRDAFVLVSADLPLPGGVDKAARVSDSQVGLSLRVVSDYDINTDKFITRIDVLYGWSLLRPEMAVKIVNNPAAL